MHASRPFPDSDRDSDKPQHERQDEPRNPDRDRFNDPPVEDPRAPRTPVRDPTPSTHI